MRYLLTVFLTVSIAFAQQTMTVAKLMGFIQSSIEQKNPDNQVANIVSKTKLTEKFTLADLKVLQDAGVGPKTLTALAALVTQSANLAPPAPKAVAAKPAGPPEPSDAEKKEVIGKTREWALNYVKSLPDFLCLERTDRSVDPHYHADTEGSWSHEDTVTEKLTFFDHQEKYDLYMHNDTAVVNKTSDSLGGARSTGEWASLLGELFEPSSETSFRWVAWKQVRGKLVYEYQYQVDQEKSHETISHGNKDKITAGFRGSVFIQKGANVVLRVTVIPDIPPSFPVQDVNQIVDYEYQNIGTQQFLLPYKSTVTMRDGQMGNKNDIQWILYRKYSADTNLTFDDPDTTPAASDQKAPAASDQKK
jgi:hypothetical protein